MEKIMIEDFEGVTMPETITLLDNDGKKLLIEVYEDQILINTNENSWCIVDDAKKQFEQIINPDKRLKKYIKHHIKNFLISLSKLF